MAGVPNEFLVTAFEDRQTLLETASANQDVNQLKDVVDSFASKNERQRNEKFQNNLDTIVSCVAFKRSCNMSVGRWMTINCPDWDPRKRARIIELCKFSAGIYMNWPLIVHNLTNSDMVEVDAREFSLRKLYEARKFSWCLDEMKQSSTKKTKEKHDNTQQEYDETKYANIVGKIKDEQILEGVGFDEDQAVLIGDRIKKDLVDMCREARV